MTFDQWWQDQIDSGLEPWVYNARDATERGWEAAMLQKEIKLRGTAVMAVDVGAQQHEEAIRAKLIELGWTPPKEDHDEIP